MDDQPPASPDEMICGKCGIVVKKKNINKHYSKVHGKNPRRKQKSLRQKVAEIFAGPKMSAEEFQRKEFSDIEKAFEMKAKEKFLNEKIIDAGSIPFGADENKMSKGYNKCYICGKPALPDDEICKQCSSE